MNVYRFKNFLLAESVVIFTETLTVKLYSLFVFEKPYTLIVCSCLIRNVL